MGFIDLVQTFARTNLILELINALVFRAFMGGSTMKANISTLYQAAFGTDNCAFTIFINRMNQKKFGVGTSLAGRMESNAVK